MAKKANSKSIALIDELLKEEGHSPEAILGEGGILKTLTKRFFERAIEAELSTHLGYEKHDSQGTNSGNSRNGCSKKTLKTESGELTIETPRDRSGTFSPQLIPKGQTRFEGFDDKIISLYARGMSTRDIQEQLKDLYQVDVSATLISNVTNAVVDQVKEWQNRSLDKLYPIVYMDALVIKVKDDNRVKNKAFYLAIGVDLEGQKQLLGIWISENEGARFWLNVLTELKNRGVEDILVACVDGLKGFPEAITTVYPNTEVQLCLVHMVRNSLKYVSWKQRKEVARDLKTIYRAATEQEAGQALEDFAAKWDDSYPTISKMWRNHWENIIPFFAYPPEIRKVIYTTNAIESLNMSLRKVIKNKRVFPSDEAALKLLYLALNNISKKWTMPVQNWKSALSRFAIMHEERLEGLIG